MEKDYDIIEWVNNDIQSWRTDLNDLWKRGISCSVLWLTRDKDEEEDECDDFLGQIHF